MLTYCHSFAFLKNAIKHIDLTSNIERWFRGVGHIGGEHLRRNEGNGGMRGKNNKGSYCLSHTSISDSLIRQVTMQAFQAGHLHVVDDFLGACGILWHCKCRRRLSSVWLAKMGNPAWPQMLRVLLSGGIGNWLLSHRAHNKHSHSYAINCAPTAWSSENYVLLCSSVCVCARVRVCVVCVAFVKGG